MTPNELEKIEKFKKAIEETFDNESAAIACLEVAKELAITFAFHITTDVWTDKLMQEEFDKWLKQ